MAFSRFAYLASTALVALATPAFAQEAPAPTTADEGDTITVTGIRKSIADSIATKRDASSIVDVISAEDVGKFPDANVADSLARLPGVTVDRQFGEGEQLSIAGVEPALNRLTVDGHSVASADWGGNPSDRSSRSFNYSLLSPTIISQAVVYKTPEARLQEGAIGASVDVVTRKPLDLKSGTIAATAGGEYNDRAKRGSFRGSALYSWHNADDTIGFLGSVSYDKEQLSRAGSAVYSYSTGTDLLNNAPATATINGKTVGNLTTAERSDFANSRFASFIAREFFKQERERIGFSGAVQARPTDNLTVTGTALIIRGNYDNVSNSAYTYGNTGARLISATAANGIVTAATFSGIAAGQTGATGQLDTNYRRTRLKNDSVTLLIDWKPGDWTITGNVGATKASGGKDPEYLLDFRTQKGFTAGANGRNTTVNWDTPASDPTMWISTFNASGPRSLGAQDLARNGGVDFVGRQIGGIPLQSGFTLDKEVFGQLDFKHPVEFGPIKEILFGGRYVNHDNSQTTFSNAVFTNQRFTLGDLNYYVLDSNLYNGLNTAGNGTPYATLDKDGIISALQKYGTKQIDRGFSFGDYFGVNEKIAAAYAQANFEMGKLRGNVGLRFAHTSDEAMFYTASNRSGQLFPTYTFTPVKNDYNRLLPSANLIYQAGEDVVLRASAAKVLARQRYSDLAGSLSLDDNQLTGSGGNPALKPYEATNYGLSAEWYFAPASFLAAEFFYRDISNYTVTQGRNETQFNVLLARDATYFVNRPINGGTAQVTGFSLSGNTNLIWGFGFQGSYTFADAEASLATGLPYLSRHTLQLSPYYENGPFQARVSYNRRSKYFYRFGRQSSQDYTDAYRQLDAQISYALTEGVSITAQASNLLDETYYQYSRTPNAPTSLYKNGRVFSLNATFRM